MIENVKKRKEIRRGNGGIVLYVERKRQHMVRSATNAISDKKDMIKRNMMDGGSIGKKTGFASIAERRRCPERKCAKSTMIHC